jgi:uncharacterized protein (DUF427 family)
MASKPIKIPGADHPITITPNPARVVVTAGGKVIADTVRSLTLQEAAYPPVLYIPRADIDMALLARSDHKSYCPYKGEASYFGVRDGTANAAWSYETPYDAVSEIIGHLAFYPDRVDSIVVT